MRRHRADLVLLAVHELRDPIAVIMGYAQLLAGKPDGPLSELERRELATTLQRSAQHLVRLTAELSDLANLERRTLPFNFLKLSLDSLLDAVEAERRVATGTSGPSLEIGGTAGDVELRADPVRLPKAVSVLLSTVAARAGDDVGLVVRHEIREAAGRRVVALTIGDRRDADGGPAAPGPRVRFGEADERLRLDATLACRIVEAHGGQVWSATAGLAIIALPVGPQRGKRGARASVLD